MKKSHALLPLLAGLASAQQELTTVMAQASTPFFIPRKHAKQTYGAQRRAATKRNNIRKRAKH